MVEWKNPGVLRSSLAQSLTDCISLGKSLLLPGPYFPSLYYERDSVTPKVSFSSDVLIIGVWELGASLGEKESR